MTTFRAVFPMLTLTATNGNRFRVGQWLLLSDYGDLARRHMIASWTCVAGLALVVLIWLPLSRLSIDQASWWELGTSLIYGAAAFTFYLLVSYRLREKEDRLAICLRAALERLALLFRGGVLIAAIGIVGLVFTYLATASALPLKDAFLAKLDSHLGFHWPSVLGAINGRPFLADLLVKAYGSTAPVTQGVVIWLAIRGRGERLSELLALLCLCSLGLAVGMLLFPAAGAFVYFEPAHQLFDNYVPGREMWPFLDAFNGLRDGSLTKIDISSVQGVVSFPSFHTMLGIITTYALRDTRILLIPAAILNGTMIVATLPVGGHYLVDTLVGAAIGVAAFHGLRYGSGRRASSQESIAAFWVNGIRLSGMPTLNHRFLPLLSRLRFDALECVFITTAAGLVAYIALGNLH
jgi:membrane-associated phospholipid phosphatase